MTDLELDPAAMDPLEFARLVKRTPASRLADAIRGPRRRAILDVIFDRMPGVFQPTRAADIDAVLHWCVGDRPDGGVDTYELVIADGTCKLSARPERVPTLAATIGGVDFLRMVTGNANPMRLFLTGRLKARGDLALTMRLPHLFLPPKP